MGKFKDLTGQKFGRLTVVERAPNKGKRTMWFCVCDCIDKTTCVVSGCNLKSGHSKSCGCIEREKPNHKTHGMTKTRIYKEWLSMKQRCSDLKVDSYIFYGARGITVCAEWLNDFQAFCDWAMANGYSDDLTLDRIDPNGNYEPSNCRWITMKEQQNNRRSNHYITHDDRTQTAQQWGEETGISAGTILMRIRRGWSIDRALTEKPYIGKNQSYKRGDGIDGRCRKNQ